MSKLDELTLKLSEATEKQYSFPMGTHSFTYWQGQKYWMNEQIEEILPENKKIALLLYRKTHKSISSADAVKWVNESKDFVHDWDGEIHRRFLTKADELLVISDYITLDDIINTIWK